MENHHHQAPQQQVLPPPEHLTGLELRLEPPVQSLFHEQAKSIVAIQVSKQANNLTFEKLKEQKIDWKISNFRAKLLKKKLSAKVKYTAIYPERGKFLRRSIYFSRENAKQKEEISFQ